MSKTKDNKRMWVGLAIEAAISLHEDIRKALLQFDIDTLTQVFNDCADAAIAASNTAAEGGGPTILHGLGANSVIIPSVSLEEHNKLVDAYERQGEGVLEMIKSIQNLLCYIDMPEEIKKDYSWIIPQAQNYLVTKSALNPKREG